MYVLKLVRALNIYNFVLRAVGSRAVVGIYQAWFLASFAVAKNACTWRPPMFGGMQPSCWSSMLWSSHMRTGVPMCWTSLCTPTWFSSALLYSLYSLYAFQHSGVIHPTAFYIQLLLIFCFIDYITGWIIFSLAQAFWKYIRSKDFQQYRHIPCIQWQWPTDLIWQKQY